MEREQDFDNEIEIDLKDLFLEIISYWQWIILVTIATGAVAFAISRFMITPMYESTSELYVLSKSTSITSLADIQTGTSLTNDYIVVVKGRPVLDQVIENLNLNESYKTLGGRVTLDNPSNSRVLNITVTDPNPQMAKTIADEIAKVASAYIAEKMKQDPPTIIQSGYDDGGAVSPNIGKNTVIGAFAGAFLSIAVIVVSYLFNDTIIDTEDVEKKLGMNVLGTLPLDESEDDGEQGKGRKHGRGSHRKKRKKEIGFSIRKPVSGDGQMELVKFGKLKEQSYTMKESLRALKTNIQFCGDDIRTLLVTSSVPNEGKSTVALDLARSLTESGNRVLFIDTDMRKSVLAGRLRATAASGGEICGLSHYLSGQRRLEEVMYGTEIPGLFMIFAGPSVPNPTEILEKKYFQELLNFGKEHFNYIIIDCAPIGAAIDAAVVAKYCDGAIIVIGQGMASARMIQSVKKQLEASGVRILGAVLNKVNNKKNSHVSGYYGNYYGSYYGRSDKA